MSKLRFFVEDETLFRLSCRRPSPAEHRLTQEEAVRVVPCIIPGIFEQECPAGDPSPDTRSQEVSTQLGALRTVCAALRDASVAVHLDSLPATQNLHTTLDSPCECISCVMRRLTRDETNHRAAIKDLQRIKTLVGEYTQFRKALSEHTADPLSLETLTGLSRVADLYALYCHPRLLDVVTRRETDSKRNLQYRDYIGVKLCLKRVFVSILGRASAVVGSVPRYEVELTPEGVAVKGPLAPQQGNNTAAAPEESSAPPIDIAICKHSTVLRRVAESILPDNESNRILLDIINQRASSLDIVCDLLIGLLATLALDLERFGRHFGLRTVSLLRQRHSVQEMLRAPEAEGSPLQDMLLKGMVFIRDVVYAIATAYPNIDIITAFSGTTLMITSEILPSGFLDSESAAGMPERTLTGAANEHPSQSVLGGLSNFVRRGLDKVVAVVNSLGADPFTAGSQDSSLPPIKDAYRRAYQYASIIATTNFAEPSACDADPVNTSMPERSAVLFSQLLVDLAARLFNVFCLQPMQSFCGADDPVVDMNFSMAAEALTSAVKEFSLSGLCCDESGEPPTVSGNRMLVSGLLVLSVFRVLCDSFLSWCR